MDKYEILRNLVSFNTVADEENDKIIKYIKDYLKRKNFKVEIVTNKETNKSCLIATYGENPNLTFVGHSDTVPFGDGWSTNPLNLTLKGNNLYGRGACDMKGGIAAFLEAIDKIDLDKLNRGLQIAITYDEEVSFKGVYDIKDYPGFSNNILLGEPTDNIPIIACKGCMEYKAVFLGKAAHSANPEAGESAIISCYNFIKELLFFGEKLKKNRSTLFKDIPYTTMNIGVINGGKAINIVPDRCELYFDFRTVSKEINTYIQNEVNKMLSKYHCNAELTMNIEPFMSTEKFISIIEEICKNETSSQNYVTEANILSKENTVILGPGPVTAHQVDENISTDSYNNTIHIYKKMIEYFCEEKRGDKKR